MKETFEKLWGKEIPLELEQLILFQEEQSAFENYAQGFGVETSGREGLQHGWSDNPNFLGKLYPFAQANGTGAFYAIWDDGEGYPMGDMPVVVFGDEGGAWVVADTFGELLQLLTFDTEISVDHDGCYFYKNEKDYKQNPDTEKFRKWFSEFYTYLPRVNSNQQANEILKSAQQKHQAKFNAWLSSFDIKTTEYNPDKKYTHRDDKYDGDYSEVKAEFDLLEFRPQLKPNHIEQFDRFFLDLPFKTNTSLKMCILQPEGVRDIYSPSTGGFDAG